MDAYKANGDWNARIVTLGEEIMAERQRLTDLGAKRDQLARALGESHRLPE